MRDWEVSFLAVDPDFRGRGLGGRLVAKMEALAPAGCRLVTHADDSAVAYWSSKGFRRASIPVDLGKWLNHYGSSKFMLKQLP